MIKHDVGYSNLIRKLLFDYANFRNINIDDVKNIFYNHKCNRSQI